MSSEALLADDARGGTSAGALPPPAPLNASASAHVIFLTLNDVYELFPNTLTGMGGIAEAATLLVETRARLARETAARVVVTLNGDFLWRSELDRRDKGAMMVQVLHALQVDVVVLGNHEFDFGAPLTRELLRDARFAQLGSNVRCTDSSELFPGVSDVLVLPLANGLRLGIFGVCTTVTGRDPFAGDSVRFEDEVVHARRCVRRLQSEHKVDAVVAVTHLSVDEDQRLARQVPGIHLILGGHDHTPFSLFAGGTFIHKSGMDALWLGQIDMRLERKLGGQNAPVEIAFCWTMLANRGYSPDPGCLAILQAYVENVRREDEREGRLQPLAISTTPLDGTRETCRTTESNLGNLIADALRSEMEADVGLLNAGAIKGDMLHPSGLVITQKWLETYLPLLHPVVVVEMRVSELQTALTHWLRRSPSMNSTFPQVSGVRVVYSTTTKSSPFIRSIEFDDTTMGFRNGESSIGSAVALDRLVKVAVPRLPKLVDWKYFAEAEEIATGPSVRDVVAQFVASRKTLEYQPTENRIVVVEGPQ